VGQNGRKNQQAVTAWMAGEREAAVLSDFPLCLLLLRALVLSCAPPIATSLFSKKK